MWWALPLWVAGCGSPGSLTVAEPAADAPERLDPADRLIRASMAVRGTRPTTAELRAVRADPDALPGLVDAWLEDPRFGETVRDMWAEILLLRDDTFNQLPALGELTGTPLARIHEGTAEEPLALVEHIVREDRPFTEIVTADYAVVDDVSARMYGLPYDFDQGGWQVTRWADDRPVAGLLSSAQVWRRWESDGSNFNRGRANMVASRLLCEDFESRDIVVAGGVDIADEAQVALAVQTQPGCVSCHQALDPLAAYFWGYKRLIHRNYVADSITAGCEFDWTGDNEPEFGVAYLPEDYCYPLRQYNPADEDDWEEWGLRAPSYYGTPARDLAEVGELIAEDPRFSQCMARRFFGYLTRTDAESVPFDVALELQRTFEDSGFSAKALVKAAVLHPRFATLRDPGDPLAGLRLTRPEQYARAVEDLTGYRWYAAPDRPGCADPRDPDVARFGSQCWGDVDLTDSDVFGFRAMAGGVDGKVILRPTATVTPTRTLVDAQLAADAAGFVVAHDRSASPGDRRLLDPSVTDEAAVRAQLVELHARILGLWVEPGAPEVDDTLALWEVGLRSRGDAEGAWTVVLTAMLRDPRLLFF